MGPAAVMSPGTRLEGLARYVAARLLLPVAIVAGLLAMHTLTPAGTPAIAAPASVVAGAAVSNDHGTQLGTAQDDLDAGEPGGACDGCGATGHAAAAMACVLALLLAVVVLVPPGPSPRWVQSAARTVRRAAPRAQAFPRPPSLHTLCISRT